MKAIKNSKMDFYLKAISRPFTHGQVSYYRALSFTICLEIVLSIKSTNKKHGGFDVTVSLLSWGHALTTAHV